MLSRFTSRCLPALNGCLVQSRVIVRGAYQVPGNDNNYEQTAIDAMVTLKELKVLRSLIPKVDYQLKNYHFPNSVRKHVLTRSILPSIKTKEYIYKVKARLENEKLREVCNNHIDPMNRYN
ncbi:hypothetical protein WA577_003602, partial [Blastocystis sp. JDR]